MTNEERAREWLEDDVRQYVTKPEGAMAASLAALLNLVQRERDAEWERVVREVGARCAETEDMRDEILCRRGIKP